MDHLKNIAGVAMQLLGVDQATFEKMAESFAKTSPELRKRLEDNFTRNISDKGFNQAVSELQQELNEVLNHVKSPDVGGTE